MEYLELAGKSVHVFSPCIPQCSISSRVTYANVMRILTSVSEALAYYLAHAPERPAGPPQSESALARSESLSPLPPPPVQR